ncbi:MAG: LLM class flavin-dependent oxidoreductase [Acidimicrobiia bacterium]|nr:LLM class flavin-dependent oxidoreductase [Acidimicrobiia bacterium]
MKFHWFHLMPYTDLPDDFREKNRSVWVDVNSRLFDPLKGHGMYHDFLDELEYADQVGFDGICCNEHHQNAYGLMPSPNLVAATLTRRTQNAKLVVMGNSVALYNPPVRVAEEFAMLDVMSGGRLIAGFPVGTPMDTVFCYGENPATLRDKYREGVDLVVKAWTTPDPFVFNGKYTQLRYVNPWPRPIQQPHPPVWIPGGGSVETWEWCVRNDFLYAYLSYFGYQRGRQVMDGYWETVDRLGADRNPYRAGFLQFVGVADSDAHAEELYSEAALYFYNRCLNLFEGFANPPGYSSVATLRKGITGQVQAAAQALSDDLTWKDIVDRGYVVAGSPQTVVDHLNEMADTMNVGHLMLLLQFGNLPKERVYENTSRFIGEVAPKLRDRFDEWDDKWYPTQSLPAEAQAQPAPVGDAKGSMRDLAEGER